jgi:hypothetical protein
MERAITRGLSLKNFPIGILAKIHLMYEGLYLWKV